MFNLSLKYHPNRGVILPPPSPFLPNIFLNGSISRFQWSLSQPELWTPANHWEFQSTSTMAHGAFPIHLQVGVLLQNCLKLDLSFRSWLVQSSGAVHLERRLAHPRKWKTHQNHLKSPEIRNFTTFCRQIVNYLCNFPNPQDLLQDWGTSESSVVGFFLDGKGREDWKLEMYKR